jgi:hypothetical protein
LNFSWQFSAHHIACFYLFITLVAATVKVILWSSLAEYDILLFDGCVFHFFEIIDDTHYIVIPFIYKLLLIVRSRSMFIIFIYFWHNVFFYLVLSLFIFLIDFVIWSRFMAWKDRIVLFRSKKLLISLLWSKQNSGPFSHLRISHLHSFVGHGSELFNSILARIIEPWTHDITLSLNIEIFLLYLIIPWNHLLAYQI